MYELFCVSVFILCLGLSNLLNLDDLVVLRRNRTDDGIIHSTTSNTIQHVAQNSKLWWEKFARPTPASLYKALEIIPTPQQGIYVRLNERNVQLIITKTPSYPHGASVLKKRTHYWKVEIVAGNNGWQRKTESVADDLEGDIIDVRAMARKEDDGVLVLCRLFRHRT